MSRSQGYRTIPAERLTPAYPPRSAGTRSELIGITVHLEKRAFETAQKIGAHESPPATKLYDRTDGQLTIDEIQKISVRENGGSHGKLQRSLDSTVPYDSSREEFLL